MPYLEKLKEYRDISGLSQKELGAKVGVSEASMSNYETGKREPELKTLCALADFFDITLDMLVRGKEKDRLKGRSRADILKEFDSLTVAELHRLSALLQSALAEKEFQAHLRQDGQANQ